MSSLRDDGSDERTHLVVLGRFDDEENTQPTAERIVVSPDGVLYDGDTLEAG